MSVCRSRQRHYDYNDHDDLIERFEGSAMGGQSWTVAEAKAKFSELIERAMSEGPQTITRKGRTAAVVVGAEEWRRKTARIGNLAEFLAASPLPGSSLKVRRLKQPLRNISR
jgi:prevent-host-death family protein